MSTRYPSRLGAGLRAGMGAFVRGVTRRRYGLHAIAVLSPVLVAGCGDTPGDFTERAYGPLPPKLIALMQEKGTTLSAPVLIRAFKKEAEVQIWKMKADGHYTLLKSYPICRWSGQLGPKKREGDRQVPEGFYKITPAQMNPHSNYYLSFNVGYPNTYDRVHGYTGSNIMVHGVCSSAGCFSMTNQQIAEIYAIAREAFAGGQQAIQMQSYPFYMTAANFALYRLDPNIAFWKELKVGNDNFEVTKKEIDVGVCNSHYVFNAKPADGRPLDPTGPCPVLTRDRDIELEVAAREKSEDAKVAELVAAGVKPIRTVYADGGQNPLFSGRRIEVSRPEALAEGPVNVPMHERKAKSLAQLEAAKRKAEEAAAAAHEKAAAAHAVAYSESTATTSGPAAPVQAAQLPRAAALPRPGFQLPTFGSLFAVRAPSAPAPAPDTLAAAPQKTDTPPPHLASRSVKQPNLGLRGTAPRSPAKLAASDRSTNTRTGPGATKFDAAKGAAAIAQRSSTATDAPKAREAGTTRTLSQTEAEAEAAKAAYAASMTSAAQSQTQISVPFLNQGF